MTSLVKGITLNSNLYTNQKEDDNEDSVILPKQAESDNEESKDPTIQSESDYSAHGGGMSYG
jgi:hypothetical protein